MKMLKLRTLVLAGITGVLMIGGVVPSWGQQGGYTLGKYPKELVPLEAGGPAGGGGNPDRIPGQSVSGSANGKPNCKYIFWCSPNYWRVDLGKFLHEKSRLYMECGPTENVTAGLCYRWETSYGGYWTSIVLIRMDDPNNELGYNRGRYTTNSETFLRSERSFQAFHLYYREIKDKQTTYSTYAEADYTVNTTNN